MAAVDIARASPLSSHLRGPAGSSSESLVVISRESPHKSPQLSSNTSSSRASSILSRGSLPPLLNDSNAAEMNFQEWITQYSSGRWAPDAVPVPPPAISTILEEETEDAPVTVDETLELYSADNECSAEGLLAFYKKHRYLPAPKSTQENDRLRVMQKYGLDQSRRKEAIERVCRHARRYFKTPTVVITLIFENEQVMASETGWDPVDPSLSEPLRRLTLPAGVCTHAMTLQNPDDTFIIADSSKDWRFNGNPYITSNGGGLSFYASSNIWMPGVAPSGASLGKDVPVGTICIISDKPRKAESFSELDRATLKDLADMVAREFQLGYEQSRRQYEMEQADYIGTCLDTAFILPNPLLPTASTSPHQAEPVSGRGAFCAAAEAISRLTHSPSLAILDLRNFRASEQDAISDVWGLRNGSSHGSINLLGAYGTDAWESVVKSNQMELCAAVSSFMSQYRQAGGVTSEMDSPLWTRLLGERTATCLVPTFDVGGLPVVLVVATSSEPHFSFEESDRRFMRNMGAVIFGSLLRQRAIEADRAKMTFVGQISHDFRLPLHGIASQIDLIREFSPPAELERLAPNLDAADVCLESLRSVLDDTLDFASYSLHTPAQEVSQKKPLVEADLEVMAEQVIMATWVRQNKLRAVESDPESSAASHPVPVVDAILEIEERQGGWKALVDVGGVKRVLLNLLGNAIKFTRSGHVKVTLRQVPSPATLPLNQSLIAFDVEDTGCGMSENFVRDGLFTPFMQENSFSHGSGLGLSICQSLMKRMGGNIDVTSVVGKGTTMRVSLPLTMIEGSPQLANDSRLPIFTQRTITSNNPTPPPTSPKQAHSKPSSVSNVPDPTFETPSQPIFPLKAKAPIGKSAAPDVRVLIAEDNPIARNILTKLLSGKGISFVSTEDGQEAVDAYKASQGTFNLFLADIQMPNKDGIEASREIRAYEKETGLPRCRIVALTGLSAETQLVQSLGTEGPIDAWVVKGGKSLKVVMEEVATAQKAAKERIA